MTVTKEPAGIRLGIVRGISYGLFGPSGEFVPQARGLGAGCVRAYVFWSQVEPEPGRYTWDAVDALLRQLDGKQEIWITVCSSSPWATRTPTTFLPPSPAHDLDAYRRFVRALVMRCARRVRYWQCDNEPSNTALLWAGTAEEYVRQQRAFHQVVAEVDPGAAVVLGGCGYDMLSSPQGSEQRRFFDEVLGGAGDAFDLFDIHLYDDPTRIPVHVETVRRMMRAHGCEKPVVVGEYNGPSVFDFPEAEAAMRETMIAAFAEPSTGDAAESPERRAMASLYERRADLPPTLQMFMDRCPGELDDKRYRMACRGLAMRNLLALSLGIRRTLCWNLAPEVPNYNDPLQMLHLMFATYALMDYDPSGALVVRHPSADAFARLAALLGGATAVTRLPADGDIYAFEVERGQRAPLLALWHQRDPFRGEDEPPVAVDRIWTHDRARAVDVFGDPVPAEVDRGRLRLPVSITPLFVSPG